MNAPMRHLWNDKDINELSHSELIDIVKFLERDLESTRHILREVLEINKLRRKLMGDT